MNYIKFFITTILIAFLGNHNANAQVSNASFEVVGNCGMCKKRIENAALEAGAKTAVWQNETQQITVTFDSKKIKLSDIKQKIANAGHDNNEFRAPDEIYEKLHECCLYDRLDANKTKTSHDHDNHKKDEHDEHDHGHEHEITGVVVNENSKGDFTPIVGATLFWKENSAKKITTNENGVFKIKHEKGYRYLIVSHANMVSDTIEVKNLHEVLMISAKNNVLGEVLVSRKQKSNYISSLSPNRVEVLTSRELFKAACCDLSESFETNVSVDVVSSDAVTGSKQIQMLGLSGIYSQLTVENLPGPRGFSSALGLNSIAGTWIESISISKGIGTVANGFENMSGQINVELKKPQNSERLFFNAYANNNGRSDFNLNLSQKINHNWSVGLLLHDNFMYRKHTNFSNNGYRDMPTGNTFSGINRWHYENGKGVIAQFGIKYLHDNRIGGQIDFNEKTDKLTKNKYGLGFKNERVEGFAKIGYVFPTNKHRSIGLQLSAIHYNQESFFGLNTYDNKQSSGYANLIYHDIIGSVTHKYKVGASLQYDNYEENLARISSYNLDINRKESVSGAFAEYTYSPVETFDAVVGIRQDYNNLYGWFTTPRAVIRYQPIASTTLRISSGRGQRTANIFAENLGIFASSRTINNLNSFSSAGNAYGLKPEVSWNTGFTVDHQFRLFGRESGISVELFHNNFQNQVVVDYENPQAVSFYNLAGKSFSNSLQTEFRFMPAPHLEARMAYRLLDVKTDFEIGRLSKPLTAKHRGFMNLAYNLHSGWSFDYTLNIVGEKRLPSTASNPVAYQLSTRSNAYATMNAQISKTLGKKKNLDLYLGGENLTNYYQNNPILAFDDPFGPHFDTNLLWGPLTGRMFYMGIRYHIK